MTTNTVWCYGPGLSTISANINTVKKLNNSKIMKIV